MNFPRRAANRSAGFSLVEVSLALGIAVFCLVAIFGLLTVGMNSSSLSIEQTNATNILSAVAGDLRTAPDPYPKGGAVTTAVYKLNIPAAVPSATTPPFPPPVASYLDANGQLLTSVSGARYQLGVWMKPGVGREATIARVILSWPPGAVASAGSVETVVALDRN